MHSAQRASVLLRHRSFIRDKWLRLRSNFADGADVTPSEIWPRLELVESNTWQSDLFRIASLTWSMPVSQGYGRRMRFLVWDDCNDKLIGLFALGDPVFNLSARDQWIGWDVRTRRNRLVNVMDAYVLGAVPPYSLILAGKLVASVVRSSDVREAFAAKYSKALGLISGRRKKPVLAMVTTTSAFGRSSLYNRLRIDGHDVFRPLGYTQGFGHFHIPDEVFVLMRRYLRLKRHAYAKGFRFGEGPNWRMRAARKSLELLGLNPHLLRHGIKRQVFASILATNARAYLNGDERQPVFDDLVSVADMGLLARERWIVPRALRDSVYSSWARDDLLRYLMPESPALAPTQSRASPTGTHGAC